jgi:hypothetical protein
MYAEFQHCTKVNFSEKPSTRPLKNLLFSTIFCGKIGKKEADLSTRLQSEQSWLNLHWSASLWAILGNGQDCRQFCQKFAISRSDPLPPPTLPGQPKNLNFKFCIEF